MSKQSRRASRRERPSREVRFPAPLPDPDLSDRAERGWAGRGVAVADFDGLPIEACAEFGRLCSKRLMDDAKEPMRPHKLASGLAGAFLASFMFPFVDAWFWRGDREKVLGWAIKISDLLFSAGPVAQEQAWQNETLASIWARVGEQGEDSRRQFASGRGEV